MDDYLSATEEEFIEYKTRQMNDEWERWFEMVAWDFPEREGFEF